jgi:alkanesulfonate monooxygenase SsuD/methylene tetrahydromethanopterin reductase-like flavin-dependent oxidoreductase (luciferase family)/hemerythrin-like domain-containing protein
MADYGHDLQFGVFLTPDAANADRVLELASLAEVLGLDLVTVQDHPYQARFLDTWTLLSVIAARTSSIRVAPNVANLPLRQPVVLARSVATLDILSGGRVELGLGAGAFWDAIAAVGGPRRSPGESVDALAEAIEVIRDVWRGDGGPIRHDGRHYRVLGAHPGPAPRHRVELWLGAYRPRMLALTGARADGWLPSMGYAEPDALPAMNETIDRAALAAGRSPVEIRRLYNINGGFEGGTGFLRGGPEEWVEQLAGLTAQAGISTFLLAADEEETMRRFATEVVPGVRWRVQQDREAGGAAPPLTRERASEPVPSEAARATAAGEPFTVTPTPDDGTRLSERMPWDESTRPAGPRPDPSRRYTPEQLAAGRHLIDVHDALRAELGRLREILDQVAAGDSDPAALRSFFNRMTIRQNHWTLGAFCESYCRAVTAHHTIEDRSVFPHLARSDEQLQAVLGRLGEEHETIAAMLEQADTALVDLVAEEPRALERVHEAIDVITDAMGSHFSYEERELIEPLARLGFY